jgi:hypothetical protein
MKRLNKVIIQVTSVKCYSSKTWNSKTSPLMNYSRINQLLTIYFLSKDLKHFHSSQLSYTRESNILH